MESKNAFNFIISYTSVCYNSSMSMLKTDVSMSSKTLEEVLNTLKTNTIVNGILLMGSTGNKTQTEDSDYDLTVIVNNLPSNILGINTFIDNTVTEVFFYTIEEIKEILSKEILDFASKEGWIVNWVRDGQIILDKSGLLKKVKEKSNKYQDTVTDASQYTDWQKINYNFIQNMRYFQSQDQLYLEALDVRLMYSVVEAFVGYFTIRKIPWKGEKNAIKWLKEHDIEFLQLFQSFINETNRVKKVEIYKKLAAKALDPVGGIWKEKVTSVMTTGNFNEETINNVLMLWNKLLK
ncbi:MAG: nucleotidyltransferase domain-containing protein [Patescibacteria group bacterium]|nr:nucleotidyltransferase domain-containing protein [Patescibacteria group bacterium]